MNSALIFGLLIALMLTGMPISIALGLTVLTFLFVMTEVPIEAVALKLFTGIESFEIMAIPFFILAGNFLTHGGVARRMIDFATSMVGHWYGGLGLAARPGLRAVCGHFRLLAGDRRRHRLDHAAGDGRRRAIPKRFGAGVIATSGALGILIPPSIVMVIYRGRDRRQRRLRSGRASACSRPRSAQLFMAGVIPGLILATHARHDHLLPRLEERLSAHAEGELGRALPRLPRFVLGPRC